MSYALIKLVHLSSAALSISLFFIRGIWALQAPQYLRRRWVRIVPHLIDSVLLASAVALALLSHQYPGTDSWLSAKVIALLAYIALGTIALKRGRTQRIRALAWIAALTVFAYIVVVARTRSAWPI